MNGAEPGQDSVPTVPTAASPPWLHLLAVWAAVILYLRFRADGVPDSTMALLPVAHIAAWGWPAILPGLYLLARAGNRPAEPALVSGAALSGAIGGWIGAQALLAIFLPLSAGSSEIKSYAPALAAQFTAAWILYAGTRVPEKDRDPTRSLLPSDPATWRADGTLALGASSALLGVLSIAVLMTNALRPDLLDGLALDSPAFTLRNDLLEILLAVVAMPLLEEYVFRFGLIGWLRRRGLPAWASVAVAALVFALAHFQPELVWARGLGGLFMGWLYVRTGRLFAPFLLHAAANCGILFAARAAAAAGLI